jgi:Domain of unknown function (DUF3479)
MVMRRKQRSFVLVVAVVLSSLATTRLVVNAFLAPNYGGASPAGLATRGLLRQHSSRPNHSTRRRRRRLLRRWFSNTLETPPAPSRNIDDTANVNNIDAKQEQAKNNKEEEEKKKKKKKRFKIVLVAGFESFNRGLYQGLNDLADDDVEVTVFADSDIRLPKKTAASLLDPNDVNLNPTFAQAVHQADSFIGSLIFDYDDVLAVKQVLSAVKGPRVSTYFL